MIMHDKVQMVMNLTCIYLHQSKDLPDMSEI